MDCRPGSFTPSLVGWHRVSDWAALLHIGGGCPGRDHRAATGQHLTTKLERPVPLAAGTPTERAVLLLNPRANSSTPGQCLLKIRSSSRAAF